MKLKDTSMKIDNEGMVTFSINMIGTKSMQTYMGTFKAKCLLSATEYINSNKEFATMIGNTVNLGEPEEIAFALVQLKHRLIDVAPFWESKDNSYGGGHLTDYNVITTVFNICMDAENEYKKMMQEEYDLTKEKINKQRESLVKAKDAKKAKETNQEEEK